MLSDDGQKLRCFCARQFRSHLHSRLAAQAAELEGPRLPARLNHGLRNTELGKRIAACCISISRFCSHMIWQDKVALTDRLGENAIQWNLGWVRRIQSYSSQPAGTSCALPAEATTPTFANLNLFEGSCLSFSFFLHATSASTGKTARQQLSRWNSCKNHSWRKCTVWETIHDEQFYSKLFTTVAGPGQLLRAPLGKA